MRWSLPFGDRLVWVLLVLSAALLVWGLFTTSGERITLGVVGLALALFAHFAAPRLLGRHDE